MGRGWPSAIVSDLCVGFSRVGNAYVHQTHSSAVLEEIEGEGRDGTWGDDCQCALLSSLEFVLATAGPYSRMAAAVWIGRDWRREVSSCSVGGVERYVPHAPCVGIRLHNRATQMAVRTANRLRATITVSLLACVRSVQEMQRPRALGIDIRVTHTAHSDASPDLGSPSYLSSCSVRDRLRPLGPSLTAQDRAVDESE